MLTLLPFVIFFLMPLVNFCNIKKLSSCGLQVQEYLTIFSHILGLFICRCRCRFQWYSLTEQAAATKASPEEVARSKEAVVLTKKIVVLYHPDQYLNISEFDAHVTT